MLISSAPMSSQSSSLPEGTLERLDVSVKIKTVLILTVKIYGA